MLAIQDYVLGLAARGELASLEEGAIIAGVSRVTIRRWLVEAKIDWRRTRELFLAKHRRRAVAKANGRESVRPTKEQQHDIASRAQAEWDRRRGRH